MSYLFETQKLTDWFERNQRDLPWRQERTPYAVWISEVMLQQTQVATVIPYFEKWMDRFPSIEALATASIEEVIKLWEGLGYYSRARNLHTGAKEIVQNHRGIIPNDPEKLATIKGLGPYTTGAVLSFAFHQKTPAVDGNVIRVLTRYFNINEDVTKPATLKTLRQIADTILPDEKHWLFNEGLIELGATICKRNPKCPQCPLKGSCQSFRQGNQATLPFKAKRTQTIEIQRGVALIRSKTHVLINRVQKGKVMSGLCEFPYIELADATHVIQELQKSFPTLRLICQLPEEKHSFTKYRATLYPALFHIEDHLEVEGFEWVEARDLIDLPFSSGHRRLLRHIDTNFSCLT